jgi:aerobic carbon-monoxide dehydrogenase medium subunit
MKPAPFDYFAPDTLPEALSLLAEHGDDAKILAGGQSLVPMMNFRLVRPKVLIDINRIDGLGYIDERQGRLHIGAMTRHRDVERSPVVERFNGLLFDSIRYIGHSAIRTRGTIGGSIVHADPTAELPLMLATLEGDVRVAGPAGSRTIPWNELFLTYFTTSMQADEICEEVIMPVLPKNAGWGFEEFTHRLGDFAIIGVAVVVETDGADRCRHARVAVAGAGATPVRVRDAEAFLTGQLLTDALFGEAARVVSAAIEPESDLHASASFRRDLAGTLTVRALKQARTRLKNVEHP